MTVCSWGYTKGEAIDGKLAFYDFEGDDYPKTAVFFISQRSIMSSAEELAKWEESIWVTVHCDIFTSSSF